MRAIIHPSQSNLDTLRVPENYQVCWHVMAFMYIAIFNLLFINNDPPPGIERRTSAWGGGGGGGGGGTPRNSW